MATLTKNEPRAYEEGTLNDLPVIAADIIYEGAAVGENGSGYFRPLVAADPFAGFATRKVDNSSGAAGDKNVNVKRKGKIKLSVAGVTAVTDEGKTVYASDDNTFTLTASGNSPIGKIVRYISGTNVIVDYKAYTPEAVIADPSGGGTIDAEARTAINSIIDALEAARIILPT